MEPLYDVVIIGAGPSGSLCAYQTAQAGLRTLVLEEHDAAGLFVNCTGIIGAEAFPKFNIPEDQIISSLQKITFVAPGGATFEYDPESPLAYIVKRERFDALLADLAVEEGAEFQYGYHARSLHVLDDGVEIRQSDDDDKPITAKAAVISTGFGSNLAMQVGLSGPRQIVYGAQAEVEMQDLDSVEIYLGREIAPDAFGWVVPLSEQRARVGLVVTKDAPHYFQNLLNHPLVAKRLLTQEPKMLLSPIPIEPMQPSFTDRVLVVGEAAGQVKTTTQGGIYYGMLCAAMAAETLVEAQKSDDFSKNQLQKYEKAWVEAIGQELKTGLSLRELFANLSDTQINALVELGTRDDIIGLVKRLAMFDWHKNLIQSSMKLPALQEVVKGGLW